MSARRRALALAALLAPAACRKAEAPASFDDPRTGVSVQAPAGWELERFPPALDRFSEALTKLVVDQAGRPVEKAGSFVHRLARLSSAPLDRLGSDDVVVSVAVVEVGEAPAIREDPVLTALVRTFPAGASLESPPHPLAVGGVAGTSIVARFSLKNGELSHRAVLGRRGGLMLVLGIASRTQAGLARARPVVESLKFSL